MDGQEVKDFFPEVASKQSVFIIPYLLPSVWCHLFSFRGMNIVWCLKSNDRAQ